MCHPLYSNRCQPQLHPLLHHPSLLLITLHLLFPTQHRAPQICSPCCNPCLTPTQSYLTWKQKQAGMGTQLSMMIAVKDISQEMRQRSAMLE